MTSFPSEVLLIALTVEAFVKEIEPSLDNISLTFILLQFKVPEESIFFTLALVP